jgi:hypothetical protein
MMVIDLAGERPSRIGFASIEWILDQIGDQRWR